MILIEFHLYLYPAARGKPAQFFPRENPGTCCLIVVAAVLAILAAGLAVLAAGSTTTTSSVLAVLAAEDIANGHVGVASDGAANLVKASNAFADNTLGRIGNRANRLLAS